MKTSRIWKYTKQELQQIIDSSMSITEVLQKIGFKPRNGSGKTLTKRIKQQNISLQKLKQNRKNKTCRSTRSSTYEQMFCKNSKVTRSTIRKKLIKQKIIPYLCYGCKISDKYNGISISLQLDHINGVNNDHRLQNLCFLCPNCHSQTPTFAGKNKPSKSLTQCKKCSDKFQSKTNRRYCEKCQKETIQKFHLSTRKFNPTKLQLQLKFKQLNYNFCATGRFYGVSDNAIRKRCKILKIQIM